MFGKLKAEMQEAARRGELIKDVWPGSNADLHPRMDQGGRTVYRNDATAGVILGLGAAVVFVLAAIGIVSIGGMLDWMGVLLAMGALVAAAWSIRFARSSLVYRRTLRWDPMTQTLALEDRGNQGFEQVECDVQQARAEVCEVWQLPHGRQIRLRFWKSFALFVHVRGRFIVLGERSRREELDEIAARFTAITGVPVLQSDRLVIAE